MNAFLILKHVPNLTKLSPLAFKLRLFALVLISVWKLNMRSKDLYF